MPLAIQGQTHLMILLVLIASVPLQFYIRKPNFKEETNLSQFYFKVNKYFKNLIQRINEFEEWLDEVLPAESGFDYLNEEDEYGEDENIGPIQLQIQLEDGTFMSNNTEGWFGSSTKPRRYRPSYVNYAYLFDHKKQST